MKNDDLNTIIEILELNSSEEKGYIDLDYDPIENNADELSSCIRSNKDGLLLFAKELLIGLPDTLQEDFEAGIFENYTEYPTSTGFVVSSIDNAIPFNNFHEGIHYGIIRSIKKFL